MTQPTVPPEGGLRQLVALTQYVVRGTRTVTQDIDPPKGAATLCHIDTRYRSPEGGATYCHILDVVGK